MKKKFVKNWIFCEKITFDQIFEFFVKLIAVIIPLYENVIRGGSNETIWFNEIKYFPSKKGFTLYLSVIKHPVLFIKQSLKWELPPFTITFSSVGGENCAICKMGVFKCPEDRLVW